MARKQQNAENEVGDNESLLSLAQRLHVSKTFSEDCITDGMKADELQEITDDMSANIVENCE